MNTKKRTLIFQIIGIIFVLFPIFNIIFKYKNYGLVDEALWYCYIIFFITGLLLYFDKPVYLSVIFAQAIVLQTPWIIDSISFTLTKYTIFESAIFFYDGNFFDYIISLHHFILIPVLLLYFLHKPYSKAVHIQFISGYVIILIMFILTKLFTSPYNNINCLTESCFFIFDFTHNLIIYYILFLIIVMGLQLGIAQILHKILPFLKKHKKNTIFYAILITNFFIISTTIAYVQTII